MALDEDALSSPDGGRQEEGRRKPILCAFKVSFVDLDTLGSGLGLGGVGAAVE